ncbi:C1 family peptidase [Seonamhaeicola marinus]|uniref:Aminopeptidase n=1 Tax=Seonamhaeicola marinus TaxID=1912246 RepID=A0A5D0HSQ1_9FLAO|nr:C1 family peptidase [Seonamhaeicola marinus]TYA74318.1 aminopeptidase [Seonamhaeicola marinus]
MKLYYLIFLFVFLNFKCFSQVKEEFKVLKLVKTSALKDQQSSGTCWSFATTSFIETEAIRLGKDEISLSPIFYVAPAYMGKAEKFIETKGKSWFDAGDLTFSVLDGYKKFGAVPEEVYNGIIEKDWQHDHNEMDNLLREMVESVGTSGYDRIKPYSWRKSIKAVLDAYLGTVPITFVYKGKLHSPFSFAREFIGINPSDYVEITSYSHIDFYKMSVLDIPANWNSNKYLNLPIEDFENVIDTALASGYSLAWDGDASEPNFDFDKGLLKLTASEEKNPITQELRQTTFENKTTTDDHNMHIIGIAQDTKGHPYYFLKNSEGNNENGGYIYISKKALLLKTISVLVHKDAIPKDILKKSILNE